MSYDDQFGGSPTRPSREAIEAENRQYTLFGTRATAIMPNDVVASPYPPRKSWDQYFMDMARVVATRATCDRKHVGAVLVRDRVVLSTGYNGSIRGLPHCDEVGHMMENGHCVATAHAEANAIVQAARNGTSIEGADIYITASPCWPCFKLIANAGIKRIVFGEFYRDDRIFNYAKTLGIELIEVKS